MKTLRQISSRILAISAWLIPVVPTWAAEESEMIGVDTVKQWSAPFRGWHYHPDHVIPAQPGSRALKISA
jgi:hypothetical protein